MKRKIGLLIAVLLVSLTGISGCAWQKFPEQTSYNVPSSIPVNIGIVLGNPAEVYGPGIVKELQNMRLFKSIAYPLNPGDPVDGVMKINISGRWIPYESNFGRAFLVGFSLFTLSPVIGVGSTGTHDAVVTLSKGNSEMLLYAIHVETPVTWGVGINAEAGAKNCNDFHQHKLATEIARRISEDRVNIVYALKSNGTIAEPSPKTPTHSNTNISTVPDKNNTSNNAAPRNDTGAKNPGVRDDSARLQKLKDMKERGVITQEDYDRKRKEILDAM
jgi:hypothetical protein